MRLRSVIGAAVIALVALWIPRIAASETLNGAGSTFIDPILQKWIGSYSSVDPNVRVAYQAVGSLQGLDDLLSRKVDFAASDAPLCPQQLADPGCQTLYFPAAVGGVAIVYNLPEIPASTRIRFTGPILADIYLGKIKEWNDPALVAVNPGTVLPSRDIVVAYRSDGSGTTYTFTDFLTKVSPEWAKKPGTGMIVEWPSGLYGRGNEGVAETVRDTDGAIGYVESTYAARSKLPFGLIQNRAGNWADATPQSITAAADSTIGEMPGDLRQSITDAPDPRAYPIVSYSYLLAFRRADNAAKTEAFSKFVSWILRDGQTYASGLGFGAVPPKLISLAADQVKQIQIARAVTAGPSCKASLGLPPHNETIPVVRHEEEEGSLSSD
jgi:phosphate transport system substrate-binding protein